MLRFNCSYKYYDRSNSRNIYYLNIQNTVCGAEYLAGFFYNKTMISRAWATILCDLYNGAKKMIWDLISSEDDYFFCCSLWKAIDYFQILMILVHILIYVTSRWKEKALILMKSVKTYPNYNSESYNNWKSDWTLMSDIFTNLICLFQTNKIRQVSQEYI